MTSIQSNEYLIIILSSCRCIISNHTCSRKKAQVPPEWFPTCQYAMQTKAMLQHPHWCDARHVICLHCTTDERKGSGLVESDENGAAGRFVTANPNKQSRGLRPTCQLLDLLQTEKYQQLAMRPRPTKCLKPCKSGFLMVSYGFPKKKNEALCVTCWFGKFLLRHIHFSKHKVTLPKPLQWPPQKRVALSPHADIVP